MRKCHGGRSIGEMKRLGRVAGGKEKTLKDVAGKAWRVASKQNNISL